MKVGFPLIYYHVHLNFEDAGEKLLRSLLLLCPLQCPLILQSDVFTKFHREHECVSFVLHKEYNYVITDVNKLYWEYILYA